jgi:ClpP class serine protease
MKFRGISAIAQSFAQPWAISRAGKQQLALAARSALPDPAAISTEIEQPLDQTSLVTVREGIATIRITGPMFRYENFFSWYLGWATYETIAREVTACRANPNIKALLFVFDTPGGEVNGASECARIIFDGRDDKPQLAFATGACCSGGYWLASAVGRIVAADTAVLGSIGVITSFLDDREFLKDLGFEEIVLRSTQSPKKALTPVDPEGRAEWQKMIDDMAAVFINAVSEYRSVDADVVLAQYGQGSVFVGQAAVDATIAEALSTYEGLLAELTQMSPEALRAPGALAAADRGRPTPTSVETSMADQNKAGGGAPNAQADETEDEREETGAASEEQENEDTDEQEQEETDPATKAASAERARVKGILALGRPGEEAAVQACIDDPKCSVADAALKLRQRGDRRTRIARKRAPSHGDRASRAGGQWPAVRGCGADGRVA